MTSHQKSSPALLQEIGWSRSRGDLWSTAFRNLDFSDAQRIEDGFDGGDNQILFVRIQILDAIEFSLLLST